jgi:hypothetical protein
MHVIAVVSAFSEIDGREILFSLNLPTSSVARCEDSLALPPFPHQKIVFPVAKVLEKRLEARSSWASFPVNVSVR